MFAGVRRLLAGRKTLPIDGSREDQGSALVSLGALEYHSWFRTKHSTLGSDAREYTSRPGLRSSTPFVEFWGADNLFLVSYHLITHRVFWV